MDELSANQIRRGARGLYAFATAIEKEDGFVIANHAFDRGWTPDDLRALAGRLKEIANRESRVVDVTR